MTSGAGAFPERDGLEGGLAVDDLEDPPVMRCAHPRAPEYFSTD
jgi:hypothetical protein